MAVLPFAVPFNYAAMVALIGFSLAAVSDGCTSGGNCNVTQVCCDGQCVSSSSCVGRYCSSDFDCPGVQSCCSRKCRYRSDCIGLSCFSSSDCGDNFESCCHGTCQDVNDICVNVVAAVIASSVIGSILFICMISMCIFFARRRKRTVQGRVIGGPSVTATTANNTRYATQGNPPYHGQAPPSYSYQQGHPYYPFPQSEQQQQAANPPPYNPETVAVSEQPPPYSAEQQEATGGVYVPKPSYGSIPSAPPV